MRQCSPHPVEGIGTLVSLAAVDGDLAADQEDEQGDRGPQDLLLRFAGDQEWTLCTEALKLRCVLPRARGTGSAGKRALNGILRSGCATSGSTCSTGLTRVKKRMFPTILATSAADLNLDCDAWLRTPSAAFPPPRVKTTKTTGYGELRA